MLKYVITATAIVGLAGCEGAMMNTSTANTMAGGKTYEQMSAEYPDLSIIEFEVLDDNNDGVISPIEEDDIGDDLTVDDDAVDAELQDIAEKSGKHIAKVRVEYRGERREQLENELIDRKIMAFLKEKATILEEEDEPETDAAEGDDAEGEEEKSE